jgi:hypothetical protein
MTSLSIRISALALTLGAVFATSTIFGVPLGAAARAEEGQNNAENPKSRRVCRYQTPSGTRMTRRVCRTQEEWDRGMDKTQQGVLEFQTENATQLQRAPGPF